ncbi:hypothetical protein LCGC14_1319830 [marine sediment metagenome]|uniref:Uncharacterized protein n=1 Tax=marine sediment metagenome TaxID=412755 RepID=A0A0F9L545_9ZZZZ
MKNNNYDMPFVVAAITLFLFLGVYFSYDFSYEKYVTEPQFTITKDGVEVDRVEVLNGEVLPSTMIPKGIDFGLVICGSGSTCLIYREDLTIEWLSENAECTGGCEYDCSIEYETHKDINKLNKCVHERNCPKTPYPVCSKYKIGNFTIEVLK